MVRLTIDSKNNRIILADTEIKPVSRNDDTGLYGQTELWYDINEDKEELKFAAFYLNDVEFEGFVLEMIDKNGVSFSTEIPGLA